MENNKYFYHGFDFNVGIESIEFLYKYLLSGKIKTRLGSISLYKKNDDFDYENKDTLFKSSRCGWIDNCVVFVINPSISAYKFEYEDSLVDEWRTNKDIDFSQVVGICLPTGFFDLSPKYETALNIEKGVELHEKIDEIIDSYGWFVGNSSESNFTDVIDEKLKNKKIKLMKKMEI